MNRTIRFVRITHRPTNTVLAEGPLGWGITPFEGNYYIRRKYLMAGLFRPNFVPGLCPYKFLYVWLNLELPSGRKEKSLAWLYWLPNPLLPFIWYRVALPGSHPNLDVQRWEGEDLSASR
jgi:uncharacterized protein (DUF427 family)